MDGLHEKIGNELVVLWLFDFFPLKFENRDYIPESSL
jgi:hypothetical protein